MRLLRLRQLEQLQTLSDGGLPTEFRIFRQGRNDSEKGPVWFDADSAESVMSNAGARDVDQIIDLEHYSIKPRLFDIQSTDTDARGYYRPEIRNGELWATQVSWTDDGADRLKSRRQRYTSPAFGTKFDQALDGGKGGDRVTRLLNVALCSMPATHSAMPLVLSERGGLDSAGRFVYGGSVFVKTLSDRDSMAKALSALNAGDAAQASQILTEAIAESDGTDADAPPSSKAAGDRALAEPMDQTYTALKAQLLSAAPGTTTIFAALTALAPRVFAATGATDVAGAVAAVSRMFTDRATADATERRALITSLVQLEAETPATAWANDAPVPRLASEALPELRTRVAAIRAARTPVVTKTPPASGAGADDDLKGFSDSDTAWAKSLTDEKQRARFVELVRNRLAKAGK